MRGGADHSKDWYAILEVDPDADLAAIKAAHRCLARLWHPDANPAPEAPARMRDLNRARDILLDPHDRAAFDRARGRTRRVASQPVHGEPTSPPGPERRYRPKPPSGPGPRPSPAGYDPWSHLRENGARRASRRNAAPDHSKDWYGFLGVKPAATTAEIRAALGRLALQMEGADITATEVMRRNAELRAAWATLGDPTERAAYDRKRAPPA